MKIDNNMKLPFFIGVNDDIGNGTFPNLMEFDLQFDSDLKLFYQRSTPNLLNILEEVYVRGSMLNGEMNFENGGHQGQAALDFITNSQKSFIEKKVLEIELDPWA